jgi:hypothetical protein
LCICCTSPGAPSQAPPGSGGGGSEATFPLHPKCFSVRAGSSNLYPHLVCSLQSCLARACTCCRHVVDRRHATWRVSLCLRQALVALPVGLCCCHMQPIMPSESQGCRIGHISSPHRLSAFSSSRLLSSTQSKTTNSIICAFSKTIRADRGLQTHAPGRRPLDRSLPALCLRLGEN